MKTIAAISTAYGIGGIGIVRISGKSATKIADKIFVPFFGDKENCLENLEGYRAKYGKIRHENEYIDDVVALVFRAPKSYTGEDVVEISCHGGLYVTRRILRAALEAGANPAEPGEFTKRAFLNGKMDLSQAEAVMDLIFAKSNRANQIAFRAREGGSAHKITEIKNKLVDISAGLSAWADYPEDDIPEVDLKTLQKNLSEILNSVDKMIENYDSFKIIKNGIKTTIIGRPNVGKSTLMNLISDSQKSIVTDIPGTTRDAIEENVMIGDIPILLIDTAGIRKTDDKVEKIGVEKAKNHMNDSEIILFMLDASSPICKEDEDILKTLDKEKTILLLNKCDIGNKIDAKKLSTFSNKTVELSALTGEGLEKLRKIIENTVGTSKFDPSDSVISNERQFLTLKKTADILRKAIKEVINRMTLDAITVLIQDALSTIMEFTGENVNETVVNRVFEKFCVGK